MAHLPADFDISKHPPNIPAMAPPPGETSNFDRPNALETALVGISSAFMALMIIVVSLRVYVRGWVVRSWWWDDTFIILGTLATIINIALTIHATKIGFGKHVWDVRAETLTNNAIIRLNAKTIIYPISILLIKISVSLLYYRLFKDFRLWVRYAVYFILASCTFFYLGFFAVEVAGVAQCSNLQASTSAFCNANYRLVEVLSGAVNAATDIYLLLLPIPVIVQLQMSLKRKIAVFSIVLAGSVACGVSIARLVYPCALLNEADRQYGGALLAQMSIVEQTTSIIATCSITLPKIKESPLIHTLTSWSSLRSLARSTRSSRRQKSEKEDISPSEDRSGGSSGDGGYYGAETGMGKGIEIGTYT